MRVYLVQHGRSFSKEEDPERSLTPEGQKEVAGMAEWAARAGIAVAEIKHSGKTRARQTAEILAANLHPEKGVKQASGMNPLDDVVAFANQVGNLEEGLMLVGHLPFLERLASFLIAGSSEHRVVRFRNAGIVCLEQPAGSEAWGVVWAVVPELCS